MINQEKHTIHSLINIIQRLVWLILFMIIAMFFILCFIIYKPNMNAWFVKSNETIAKEDASKIAYEKWKLENAKAKEINDYWNPASIQDIKNDSQAKAINYGKELIIHTAKYLGPKGSVAQMSNGMNCQNCHLDAGTKVWGNNYGSVSSTYPKYRARSGKEEDIYKRVNDCFERSLNGKSLDINSREMQSIKAYIEYIGSNVKKGEKAKASGIIDLPYLERPTNPETGKALYTEKCASCHQANGEGVLAEDKIEYVYPPLWGNNSYNHGAGLYRISRFAGYIKYNMPQGISYPDNQLSDEEAWDIAAFVNSQPRPSKDLTGDWPKIIEKPVDHPFGPFADKYSALQHKYGPFTPIKEEINSIKNKKK